MSVSCTHVYVDKVNIMIYFLFHPYLDDARLGVSYVSNFKIKNIIFPFESLLLVE